ncbi:MAG: hypothetical protein U0996_26320 [Planctomycetaceae bacterium]
MASKSLFEWLADKIIGRLACTYSAWLAAHAETRLQQANIEMLSKVEDQARELEASGKHALAEQLRRNIQNHTLQNAGNVGAGFLAQLSESEPPIMGRLAVNSEGLTTPDEPQELDDASSRRRNRTRSNRRDISADPETMEQ